MKSVRPRRRGAFTLIEVLLATVLAAMLLVALWSMLSMYSRVFEGGHARTEQSQLARILLEQITIDLQAVRQAPPIGVPVHLSAGTAGAGSLSAPSPSHASKNPRSMASQTPPARPISPAAGVQSLTGSVPFGAPETQTIASASLRPAGLFGTDTFLQIDVLQPAAIEPEREFDDTAGAGRPPPSLAEELKTIVYSFEESRDSSPPTSEPVMHLLRREMDWEQAHPGARGSATRSVEPISPLAAARSETIAEAPEATGASDAEQWLEDDRVTIVPEVIYFAMRYFDGATWSDEWDSSARQGLPMAVEVSMQLRSYDEPDAVSDGKAIRPGVDYEKVMQWKHPTHRLLIPLAAARHSPDNGNSPFGKGRFDADEPLGASTNDGPSQQ